MTEVTPGIHRLKLPIPMADSTLAHVNAYLIRGSSGFLLIDGGWNTNEAFASLQEQMAVIGAGIKDISQIVVTHIHPDHYGQAGRLKHLSGAKIAIHEIESGFIEPRYVHMENLLEQTSRLLSSNGVPPGELASIRDATLGLEQHVIPVKPDITLHGGETISTGIFSFHVLWTPGHSAGHICLYEPEKKVLISGDHILPRITSNVSRHPQSGENPLVRYLNSLQDIKKLEVELVLPGHEDPFTGLKPRIDELIRHHETRSREILTSFRSAPKTAYQIAVKSSWGEWHRWQDIPAFHKRLALFETLAHLEMMTVDGRLGRLTKDSIIYYRQN